MTSKSIFNEIVGGAFLLILASCQVVGEPTKPLISGIHLENIDNNVRPQDNFYRYVNGAWLNSVKIPANKTAIGAFYTLRDKADEDVKSIIEALGSMQHLNKGSEEQKVGDLFRSYMDQATREKLGIEPIKPLLAKIKQLKNKSELMAFFAEHQTAGIATPLYMYIGVDAKNSDQYTAHLWQYGLALPDRDYYLKDEPHFVELRQGYIQHIENMYQLVGLTNGKKAAKNILTLETLIAQLQWTKVQTRDSEKRYNKFAIENLPSLTPDIDWQTFIAALQLENQKNIIINQPDYVQGLGNVIQQTPLSTWQQYLTFHTVSSYSSYLTKALDNENFDFFYKQLNGLQQQKPQWKRGVTLVNNTLGEVIGKIYVQKHFKPQAKARMQTLVENLRSAYGKSIDELTWMSDKTKKQAHIKLAAFTPKIGYPDQWEDYSQLHIKANDLVGNIIRSGKLAYQKDINKLGKPIRDWAWGMTPQTVNAYYHPTLNEIVFPAAILQPPFFNMLADDAVNYGGIGAVIGHEMAHGFDDQGSRYDAQGNLRNWWKKQDLAEFKKRAKNLVSQYNNYQVFDDLHINGALTLGENIGDLSGLTIAYKAYQASLNGEEAPIIDGLTGDERFFMGFAQIWRNKKVEKTLRNAIATDPHAPGEFRALGALSNFEGFIKVYQVKPGDKMYIPPENRVKIW